MFTHKIEKLQKNTFEIEVDIAIGEIEKAYEKAFGRISGELSVEGFRKGKAPKSVAEKYVKREAVYEETIRELLPQIYQQIVEKEALKPVISPKIELIKAKEGEDWQVKITVAQKPEIELGDYKSKVKNQKKEGKSDDIWVPGKDKAKPEEDQKLKQQKALNEVLTTLIKDVKCEVSDLIIESELNQRLSQLVDDVRKLGLTVDAYLKSKNLTMEQVRAQYSREIEEMYKLEFILAEIAEKENITVEKEELDKLFVAITNEDERKQAQANAYFYASVLRKQKVLDFLASI